jgi:hypothetical protein
MTHPSRRLEGEADGDALAVARKSLQGNGLDEQFGNAWFPDCCFRGGRCGR